MTKLTDRKIRWIVRQKMKEILSTNDIALLQNVSGSRIRQLWLYYRITNTVPILTKPGKPSRNIINEETSYVNFVGMNYYLFGSINVSDIGFGSTLSSFVTIDTCIEYGEFSTSTGPLI